MDRETILRLWTPELLERLWRDAEGNEERMIELLRRHAGDSVDVLARDPAGAISSIQTNRLTERGNIASTAELVGDRIRYELQGKPPQKEEGVEEVLARLTRYLAGGASGWEWCKRDPSEREDGADGEVRPPNVPPMPVQVTRPVPSQEYMASVARGDNVQVEREPASVVDDLLIAGQAKALVSGREQVALAFDAISLTHLLLPDVVREASRAASGFDELGYLAVYIVGSRDELVYRLDSAEVPAE